MRYENSRILQERTLLKRIKDFADGQLSSHNLAQAQHLATAYSVALTENNVDNAWLQEMFHRVDVVPEALVLTQAANESAWEPQDLPKKPTTILVNGVIARDVA